MCRITKRILGNVRSGVNVRERRSDGRILLAALGTPEHHRDNVEAKGSEELLSDVVGAEGVLEREVELVRPGDVGVAVGDFPAGRVRTGTGVSVGGASQSAPPVHVHLYERLERLHNVLAFGVGVAGRHDPGHQGPLPGRGSQRQTSSAALVHGTQMPRDDLAVRGVHVRVPSFL